MDKQTTDWYYSEKSCKYRARKRDLPMKDLDKLFNKLLLLCACAVVFDVVITHYGLEHRWGQEGNPVINTYIDMYNVDIGLLISLVFSLLGLGIAKLTMMLTKVHKTHRTFTFWLLWVGISMRISGGLSWLIPHYLP